MSIQASDNPITTQTWYNPYTFTININTPLRGCEVAREEYTKMTTIMCDACGDEIQGVTYKYNVLCHISEHHGLNCYEKKCGDNFEPISGRNVCYDLCLTCYNKIFTTAQSKFNEIKQNSSI
jgi:hypothetical protein